MMARRGECWTGLVILLWAGECCLKSPLSTPGGGPGEGVLDGGGRGEGTGFLSVWKCSGPAGGPVKVLTEPPAGLGGGCYA